MQDRLCLPELQERLTYLPCRCSFAPDVSDALVGTCDIMPIGNGLPFADSLMGSGTLAKAQVPPRASKRANAEARFHLSESSNLRLQARLLEVEGLPEVQCLECVACGEVVLVERVTSIAQPHNLILERARNRSLTAPQAALAPEVFEPIRRQLGVANRVLSPL
jgi:hypothetical protein